MTNANTMERRSTWWNIGTHLNTTDVQEALTLSGLDYTVNVQPAYAKIGEDYVKVPGKSTIVRDDGHIYNILSGNYTPIQNKDAFDFVQYINDDIRFVKAGETYSGLIYLIGEIANLNILGDEFKIYTIFQNAHNGAYSLAMSICPLRIVCENQFNLALKESNSSFRIKHTKNIESKTKVAAQALNSISHYIELFQKEAEEFAGQKLSERQITQFLDHMFPINEDMRPSTIEQVENEKKKFIKAYNADDNQNFKGSAWGLINGLTDYITHQGYKRKVENADDKSFIKTVIIPDSLNKQLDFIRALN